MPRRAGMGCQPYGLIKTARWACTSSAATPSTRTTFWREVCPATSVTALLRTPSFSARNAHKAALAAPSAGGAASLTLKRFARNPHDFVLARARRHTHGQRHAARHIFHRPVSHVSPTQPAQRIGQQLAHDHQENECRHR